jgi:tripartite-type tricarboxylate transporter receptor subunit TctC
LADPELRERYETLGLAPLGTSPEELATRTQQQFAKYAKVIKDNQIKSD